MSESGFGKVLDCLRNARTQLDVARGEIECKLDAMADEGECPTVRQIAVISSEIEDAMSQLWLAASGSYEERDAEAAEPLAIPEPIGPNGETVRVSPIGGTHGKYVVQFGVPSPDEGKS